MSFIRCGSVILMATEASRRRSSRTWRGLLSLAAGLMRAGQRESSFGRLSRSPTGASWTFFWTIYPVNPKALDRARDRFRMSQSKSDGFDAYVLAEFLRTDHGHLRALE